MKTKAKEFIHKYGLNKSNVLSLSFLQDIAVKEHYKVYRPKNSSDEIVTLLKMEEYFNTRWAFVYSGTKNKIIAIHSDIPDSFAARMLLHELAHIFLHHIDASAIPAVSDEAEANMLVDCIYEEVYKSKVPNVISIILFVAAVFTLMISIHIFNDQRDTIESVTGTYISSSASSQLQQQSESVFVTKTGEKYHRADCYHIRDSETIELTISEAETAGYKPCKDCFPNGS